MVGGIKGLVVCIVMYIVKDTILYHQISDDTDHGSDDITETEISLPG